MFFKKCCKFKLNFFFVQYHINTKNIISSSLNIFDLNSINSIVDLPFGDHHDKFTLPLPIGNIESTFYIQSSLLRNSFSCITPGAFLSTFFLSNFFSYFLCHHKITQAITTRPNNSSPTPH
jgi:hypothetical protein